MDLKDHVYGQWIRDIRAWLETQPGPTEGDASPLDGILRVMGHKDEQLAAAEALLREAVGTAGVTLPMNWFNRAEAALEGKL